MNLWQRFVNVPSDNPDDARRLQLLNILLVGLGGADLLTLVAVVILLIVTTDVELRVRAPFLFQSGVALLSGLAVIYAIGRYWSARVGSFLLLLLITLMFALTDEPVQVVGGRSLFYFAIPITMASVLISPASSFAAAALISILLGGIALSVQLVPNVLASFGFFLVALVSWLSARSLEQALRELRAINRELDQRVADRTRELSQALTREQAESRKNQAILESIADGVIVFDPRGQAVVANPAISNLLDRPLPQIIDQDIERLMRIAVAPQNQDAVKDLFEAGQARAVVDNVEWGDKTLSLSVAPLQAASGELTGSVAVFRDVSREAEIGRMKSVFVSMISHEMRTPLNAIQGFAEMLLQPGYGSLSQKQRNMIERIMSNVRRLLNIVSDLLDQAHIEAGTMSIVNTTFTPSELLDGVNSVMLDSAQAKGLRLLTSIERDVPALLIGDPQRLHQVLSNLVTNAVKYTDRGAVKVRVFCPDSSHWAVEVADTGPGIPLGAQAAIFEPFRQADSSAARLQGGVGLGLSIVKRLTALMQGEVRLASEVGRGSAFTILLPLFRPERTPDGNHSLGGNNNEQTIGAGR